MGVVISPDSELGRELCKWEQHRTKYVGEEQEPGNPYVYRPFPKMVYHAQKNRNGKVICCDVTPDATFYENMAQYERACLDVESFNRRCTKIVQSESEYLIAKGQGWCDNPTAALEQFEREEQAVAQAASEAAFLAKRMSEKAQAEFAAAADATDQHVTDLANVPKARRGRPKKAVVIAGLEGDVNEAV